MRVSFTMHSLWYPGTSTLPALSKPTQKGLVLRPSSQQSGILRQSNDAVPQTSKNRNSKKLAKNPSPITKVPQVCGTKINDLKEASAARIGYNHTLATDKAQLPSVVDPDLEDSVKCTPKRPVSQVGNRQRLPRNKPPNPEARRDVKSIRKDSYGKAKSKMDHVSDVAVKQECREVTECISEGDHGGLPNEPVHAAACEDKTDPQYWDHIRTRNILEKVRSFSNWCTPDPINPTIFTGWLAEDPNLSRDVICDPKEPFLELTSKKAKKSCKRRPGNTVSFKHLDTPKDYITDYLNNHCFTYATVNVVRPVARFNSAFPRFKDINNTCKIEEESPVTEECLPKAKQEHMSKLTQSSMTSCAKDPDIVLCVSSQDAKSETEPSRPSTRKQAIRSALSRTSEVKTNSNISLSKYLIVHSREEEGRTDVGVDGAVEENDRFNSESHSESLIPECDSGISLKSDPSEEKVDFEVSKSKKAIEYPYFQPITIPDLASLLVPRTKSSRQTLTNKARALGLMSPYILREKTLQSVLEQCTAPSKLAKKSQKKDAKENQSQVNDTMNAAMRIYMTKCSEVESSKQKRAVSTQQGARKGLKGEEQVDSYQDKTKQNHSKQSSTSKQPSRHPPNIKKLLSRRSLHSGQFRGAMVPSDATQVKKSAKPRESTLASTLRIDATNLPRIC